MVAGVVAGAHDAHVIAAGRRDRDDPRPLTRNTAFEIGSLGKAFTAILLADMILKGEVALDAPASRYLPDPLPQRGSRQITLFDLATHFSGLPFMPDIAKDDAQPAYSTNDLYRYLARYSLPRDIGSAWEYSNLGYWLLGEALAARARMSFAELVTARVLHPLRMTRSSYALTEAVKRDFAVGHDSGLEHSPSLADVPLYNLMPAAIGFYATTEDLLAFLSAALGYVRSPLAKAIALTVDASRPIPGSTNRQALGWTLIDDGGEQLIFRDGGTFGSASCLVWNRQAREGAVVLANCVSDVSDIARHILRPNFPLQTPKPNVHTEIPLDATVLGRYVGHYEAEGEGVFTIALQGDYLTIEAPPDWGLPKLRIRPEARTLFFATELPLRVTFQIGPKNETTGMIVFPPRGQKGVPARKTD